MKRKFISAMLFGALLVAPATTFVGCADYDDDIENLQGQITNNATTLDQLTKEKIQNVEKEIESLKAANEELKKQLDAAKSEGSDADAATLAAAQKLVEDAQNQLQAALDAVNGDITGINGKITDINGEIIDLDAKYTTVNGQIVDLNGKISDLDARLLAQDGRLKSVESLLAADGKLTLAINDAQALAEKAYNLAEQTASTAEANKQAIKDVANNLKTIKESLEGQINTLSTKVNDLSQKLAEQNADITGQINSLKSQLKDAQEGISANGEEITKNSDKINEILGQLTKLEGQIAANKLAVETLESNYLTKVNEIVTEQNGLKTSIDGLKTANETVNQRLEAIDDRLDGVDGRLDGIDELIKSLAKSSDVTQSIEDLRRDIEAKIGKLNEEGKDDTVASLIAGINGNIETINGDIERIDGEITKINGLIDVLFTDLSNLVTSLIIQDNTFDAVWGQVNANNVAAFAKDNTKRVINFPENGNKKATRAFDEYTVEAVSGDMYLTINPTDIDFDNLKVDLRNSLDEKSTDYTLTRAEVAEGHLITRATKAQNGLYHFRYKCANTKPEAAPQASNVAYAATVTFPWTKKGEEKASERSVYSKYDITFRPTLATAVNSDGFGIGFDPEVNTFNQTSVVNQPSWNSIETKGIVKPVTNRENPDAAFLVKLKLNTNHKVYAKYIKCTNALNINGDYDRAAVADINKQSSAFDKVIYATDNNDKKDPDFESLTIDVNKYNGYTISFDYYIWNYDGSVLKRTYTLNFTKPLIADDNAHADVTPSTSNVQTVFADDFASTLCMDAKRSIWAEKAVKFNVLPINGVDAGSVQNVTLTSADKQTDYVSCNYNNATKVALTNKDKIKNLKFTYDPTAIELNKDYKFNVVFYDANNNELNTVTVTYTMKAPTSLNAKIFRGTNLFDNNVAIFWAMSEPSQGPVTAAYGDFSSIIAHVGENLDGLNSKIWFKNTDVYSQENNNLAYQPVSGLTSYNKFIVPFAAVDNNHIYNISAGVEYFGCNNLWQAAGGDGNFKVKFASRVLNAKGFSASATIPYGASTNITNYNINAYDPSKGFSNGSGTKMNFLGASIDAQIKDVKVYFKNEGDMPLFSKAYLADANGDMVEDMLTNTVTTPNNAAVADHIVLETKDKASIQLGQTTITLQLVVTDVFGHSSKKDQYNVTIKIDPNLTPSQINHRR